MAVADLGDAETVVADTEDLPSNKGRVSRTARGASLESTQYQRIETDSTGEGCAALGKRLPLH
jgi:hypothetical protein